MAGATPGNNETRASWVEELGARAEQRADILRVNLASCDLKTLTDPPGWWRARASLEALLKPGHAIELRLPDVDEVIDQAVLNLCAQGLEFSQLDRDGDALIARFEAGPSEHALDAPLVLRRLRDGALWPLERRRPYSIGRSRECDILLESPHASAHHASIVWRRRLVGLVDLQSAAGSYLDNRRLRRAVIDRTGLLCIGRKDSGQYLELELRLESGRVPMLNILTGSCSGQSLPIYEVNTVLGRSNGCRPQIVAPYVSRNHLRILSYEDSFMLVDHDSANGTRLFERPISRERLLPGDTIELAGERFDAIAAHSLDASSSPPRRAWLRLAGDKLPLNAPSLTIGSHEACDLSLPEAGLSRMQARLVWLADGGLQLYNLNGLAPIKVNGRLVADHRLSSGDKIELGFARGELRGDFPGRELAHG